MKTLVFDTETTGFPNKQAPLDDESQPHLIQIAALLTEGDEILSKFETIIHCPIEPSEGAFKVHGISKQKSWDEGVSLAAALAAFDDLLTDCERLVAHNMAFDLQILRIAYARSGSTSNTVGEHFCSPSLGKVPKACTMRTITPIMRRLGKRWTLDSSYRHLVDSEGFSGAHDAGADTMACFKVLRALEKSNIAIEIIEQ